jgi:hypothetical protein
VSTITIELPAEVMPDATKPEEFAHELRLAAAIHWFSRGEISQGNRQPSCQAFVGTAFDRGALSIP